MRCGWVFGFDEGSSIESEIRGRRITEEFAAARARDSKSSRKVANVLSSPMIERSTKVQTWHRIATAACVTLLLVIGYISIGVLRPMSQPPEWWDSSAVSERDAVEPAQQLENELMRAASFVRPAGSTPPSPGLSYRSEDWIVEISQAHANAWIVARLPKWLANRGESEEFINRMVRTRIRFEASVMKVGVPMMYSGVESVLWAAFTLQDNSAEGVQFRVVDAYVGRKRTPDEVLEAALDDSARRTLAELKSGRDFSDALSMRLEDGRIVRVTRIQIGDSVLRLVCHTEK